MIDDVLLDQLDGDRLFVDAQHAGFFARGRADPAGEFGEVVGLEQHVQGVFPAVLVNQVIPLGDDVAQRAAVVAERDAAVHAACALGAELVLGELVVDLLPVEDAQLDGRRLGSSRAISLNPVGLPMNDSSFYL